jgi:hypothetical protein
MGDSEQNRGFRGRQTQAVKASHLKIPQNLAALALW